MFKLETRVEGTGQRLASSDQGAAPPPAVAVVLLLLLLGLLLNVRFHDLLHVADLDQHVLRLQIGVNDSTFPVQVVQTQQHLLRNLFDERHRNAAMIPSLDQSKQVFSQHFKYHADVDTIGALMLERVEQTDHMFATRVGWLRLDDAIQQLDLVDSGFGIMSGGANDLQGDVLAGRRIAGQPDCRKVTPPELAHDHVSTIVVGFSDADRMVTALAVIFRVFLLSGGLQFFAGG